MRSLLLSLCVGLLLPTAACDPAETVDQTGSGGAATTGSNAGGTNTGGSNTGGSNTGWSNTGGSNTGGSNVGGGQPAICVAPDPAADFTWSFSAVDWPEADSDPPTKSVRAECTVQAIDLATGQLTFVCTEGEIIDAPVSVSLTAPANFGVGLTAGAKVKIHYEGHGEGHHLRPEASLSIRDESEAKLHLAIMDAQSLFAGEEVALPLVLGLDTTLCNPPCDPGSFDCSEAHRQGVTVTGPDGQKTTVLDRRRGGLQSEGRTYDIVVGHAEHRSCLNCFGNYDVLIGGSP